MNSAFKERKNRLLFFEQYREMLKGKPKLVTLDPTSWTCSECNSELPYTEIDKAFFVCPHCQKHHPISAKKRIEYAVDDNSFKELFSTLKSTTKHTFPDYNKKIADNQQKTKISEAVITGVGRIGGIKVAIGAMDSRFLMGSMGEVVGEKVTRIIEYATKNNLPLIIFTCSGGARMQEGIISLMQMAKTSAALAKHDEAKLLYISYLTHPTTGGVSASFAMLGDILLSEPQCLIGFAGKRVIASTVNEQLPENFQTAEFLQEHGFLDDIIVRHAMKSTLEKLLKLHTRGKK